MIKAIALDDEPLALNIIEGYCNISDKITLVNKFSSQEKAIRYINKFEVDLLFLDINMPKKNGIELYKSLKRKTKVIFTTAYSNYAVEGFNLNAIDYLLKPFSQERFLESITKVEEKILIEQNIKTENKKLSIRANYKLYNIPYDKILLIEAFDDYIKIHLEDQPKIVARYTMKNILNKLPDSLFKRAHRSYIVPLQKIESVTNNIIVIKEFKIPLSNTYKNIIVNYLEKK